MARPLQPQFCHARLERRRSEARGGRPPRRCRGMIAIPSLSSTPRMCSLLYVDEFALRPGCGCRHEGRNGDRRAWWPVAAIMARFDEIASRARCPATGAAAAPPCSPSSIASMRLPSDLRTRRRNATPAARCRRRDREAAAPRWETRSAGSRGLRGRCRPRPAARGCGGSRR